MIGPLEALHKAFMRSFVSLLEHVVHDAPMVGRPLAAGAAAGRAPVVLVHGYANTPAVWDVWARSLARDGFTVRTFAVPQNALGNAMEESRALGAFIDTVKAETGSPLVSLVGYSKGGLLARTHVQLLGGADDVSRIVTVATPNHGLDLGAGIAKHVDAQGALTPESIRQISAGSSYIKLLESTRAVGAKVPTTSIYAKNYDGAVDPVLSPVLEGATNVAIDEGMRLTPFGLRLSPTHTTILRDSNQAYEAMRTALLA